MALPIYDGHAPPIEARASLAYQATPWAGASTPSCALGAIYNVIADLDDLVIEVNSRTLAALDRKLAAAERISANEPSNPIDRLQQLGTAYLAFAAAHRALWRALFEHRLPDGRSVPEQYLDAQRHPVSPHRGATGRTAAEIIRPAARAGGAFVVLGGARNDNVGIGGKAPDASGQDAA